MPSPTATLLDAPETAEIGTLLAELMPDVAERPEPLPAAVADPGPVPAPLGVLPLADVFALVNWRNRPDEAKPRPLIRPPEPPPPPGTEWTTAAVLSQFGWE